MKPFSADLAALFDTGSFVSADLYSFALAGGGAAAYLTSADHDLAFGGITYSSMGPLIDRSAITQKTGLQVAQVKIDLYPRPTDLLLGQPWLWPTIVHAVLDRAVILDTGTGGRLGAAHRKFFTLW